MPTPQFQVVETSATAGARTTGRQPIQTAYVMTGMEHRKNATTGKVTRIPVMTARDYFADGSTEDRQSMWLDDNGERHTSFERYVEDVPGVSMTQNADSDEAKLVRKAQVMMAIGSAILAAHGISSWSTGPTVIATAPAVPVHAAAAEPAKPAKTAKNATTNAVPTAPAANEAAGFLAAF